MEISILAVNIFLIIILLIGAGITLIGLPGNIVILLAAWGYGYWEHFAHLNTTFLLVLLGFVILGEIVEFIAGALGAKRENASGWTVFAAVAGAITGAILGSSIIPLIGTILGAMLGAFTASYVIELSQSRDPGKAKRVAVSVAAGQITGMLFKLMVAIGMVTAVLYKLPWF